jgi:Ala-tRNA(Pro) deacylase
VAALAHVPGKELAKTVMVKVDGRMSMAVLPASHNVDVYLLKELSGAEEVHLASEEQFKDLFPDCEVGAMPPFGNLYEMPVYVSNSLAEDADIAFNAGSHRELIRLHYADFERLVKPTVANFSTKNRGG